MTMLSAHFSLEELTFSQTAIRYGIDNTPSQFARLNLDVLAPGLEQVRTLLGYPMRISSGYRCPKLNKLLRGAANSAHMKGLAADFTCPGFGPPTAIAAVINHSDIEFDQLIQEGAWVHIAFALVPRRQVLTAHFGPTGTTYSAGV